jgi:hypothetical protein
VSATRTARSWKISLLLCKFGIALGSGLETNLYSTVTRVTTEVDTQNVLVRTTPVTVETVTVTQGQNAKRDAQITPMPRDVTSMQKSDFIDMFRRQADNSSDLPPDDNVIAASLTSACLCQTYIDTTVTETYTNQPNVSVSWLHSYRSLLTSAVIYPCRLCKECHYCVQHSC